MDPDVGRAEGLGELESWIQASGMLWDQVSWGHGPRRSRGIGRLEPLSPVGLGRGQLSFVHYPICGFSQPGG